MVEWVLGIDVGTKKTGLAIGQSITGNARPLAKMIVPINKLKAHHFQKVIAEWKVTHVVIGLPILHDGEPHPMSKHIHRLAGELTAQFHLSVDFSDETLTSHEALAQFPDANDRDSAAAAILVQDYFSSRQ